MSVVRVGATKRFSDNWENIFGGRKSNTSAKKPAGAVKKPAKKSAKKSAGKKSAARAKRRSK